MIERAKVRTRKRSVENKKVEAARRAAAEAASRLAAGAKPKITPERAGEYAKLLTSGVPPLLALRYMAPESYAAMNDADREKWLGEWAGSTLVLSAVNRLNGGPWHELDADSRLQLAIDKHLAELAHFLYTNPYANLTGADLSKANTAADRLLAYLEDGDDSDNSPWRKFVEDFMSTIDPAKPPALPVTMPTTKGES